MCHRGFVFVHFFPAFLHPEIFVVINIDIVQLPQLHKLTFTLIEIILVRYGHNSYVCK